MDSYLENDVKGKYIYNNQNMSTSRPEKFWDSLFEEIDNRNKPVISERIFGIFTKKLILEISSESYENVKEHIKKFIISCQSYDLPNVAYYYCISSDNNDNYRVYFPYYKFDINMIEDEVDFLEKQGFERMKSIPLYDTDDHVIKHFYNKDKVIDKDEFMKLFCVSNHPDFARSGIETEYNSDESLRLLLSVSYLFNISFRTPDDIEKKEEYTIDSDAYFDDLLEAYESLDPKFIRQYNYWKDLGYILKNRYKDDTGLEKWKEITNKALAKEIRGKIKGDILELDLLEERMSKIYERTYYTPLTINTLAWMVKLSNPRKYNKMQTKLLRNLTVNATTNSNLLVAKLIYTYFWLELKYCHEGWYWYNGSRWVLTCKNTMITKLITGKLKTYLESYNKKLKKQMENLTDPTQQKRITNESTIISSIISGIENSINQHIISFVSSLFIDEGMIKHLNMNPMITICGDTVLECVKYKEKYNTKKSKGYLVKRIGKPEDYKTRGSSLDITRKPCDNALNEYDKWMREMFPNYELREYVQRLQASLFEGGNIKKRIYSIIGHGDNGKTEYNNMITNLFGSGQDHIGMPISLIQATDYKIGGTTPELAMGWSAKVCTNTELDNVVISCKKTKQYSGGESSFYIRDVYAKGINRPFYPTILLFGNRMPPHDDPDNQAIKRLVIIPAVSVYSSNAPEKYEDQVKSRIFKADDEFKEDLGRMAKCAAYRSITKYYSEWVEKKDDPLPKIVVRATDDYWNNNDIYLRFEIDRINIAKGEDGKPNIESSITIDCMCDAFLSYYSNLFPNRIQPEKDTIIRNFTKRLGNVYQKAWWGIEFKNEEQIDDTEEKRIAYLAPCVKTKKIVHKNRNLLYQR